jgi:hypothetical protein
MAAREERVLTQRVPAARSASPEHLGHLLHCKFQSDFGLPTTTTTRLLPQSNHGLSATPRAFDNDLTFVC